MPEDLGSLKDCYVTQENGKRALAVTGGGVGLDVFIQDQTSSFNDFYFSQVIGSPTTLTAPAVNTGFNRLIEVASIASISIGDYVGVFSGITGEGRFYFGEVLNIIGLEVELDTPIDYTFEVGDPVISTTRDLNVDGSITPQEFTIRAGGPGSILEVDITRLIAECLTDGIVDLSRFGDIIGGLNIGLVLQETLPGGVIKNKWNVKTNGELLNLAYDWIPFAKSKPNEGIDGFKWRYSLAGQDKHGVVKRVGPDSTLCLLVQDDLSQLAKFRVLGANHEVVD